MTVFLIMGHYDYEGDDIIAGFTTRERAEKNIPNVSGCWDRIDIVDVELDKDLPPKE